jgi:putative membrane-bound dehydrogenase-like protein
MKSFLLIFLLPALVSAASKPLFQSLIIDENTPGHSVAVDVDVSGAKELFLVVTDGGNGFACDWADWAEPRLVMADGKEQKLTEIEWKRAQSGFGHVRVNANAGGQSLRSNGQDIPYGIGTHANSVIEYLLPAGAKRFIARGALDEGGTKQGGGSSLTFAVYTENPGPLKATDSSTRDPEDAVAGFEVHPELQVQLFASEPMMFSPSSIDVDARGRVWVCEVVNYRSHNGERKEGDRILIIEDTDGDAKADKSIVFYQGNDVNSAHGICVLGNKALVSCGDDVFWLIDDNNDDKADRKELMFTKIGGAQHDHGIHAFHFGPDGRLYFNFGNAGKQLCDAKGELITDIHGVKCTNQNNRPYQQGMVFRCELDGSNVEVLAWNFRNNWEVAVDSFGTMWQSDNDDDGNKAVRINYVMEFGNYGYSDEMTGAGWQTPRIGLEQDIPQRHWHQNDPGVVPNVLITGAGSPTGMQVYEGDLLPKIFKGQPIHCDAGPNVVRGYITQPDGAGYKAEIVNVMQGVKDKWFRPSDVCVAPDGSLIVADWYDPGVGGHGMGDTGRGRLFRVTVKGKEKYKPFDTRLLGNWHRAAMTSLTSPNESAHYEGWQMLQHLGESGTKELKALFGDQKASPQHRARALWLLSRSQGADILNTALTDSDPNIRITALRAARQLWQQKQPEKQRDWIDSNSHHFSAAEAREAMISLRFDSKASSTVASLVNKINGTDRWAIEAVGIASDLFSDDRFAAFDSATQGRVYSEKIVDSMIGRLRSARIAQTIANWAEINLINKDDSTLRRPGKLLRALQLLSYHHREEVSKAALTIFLKADSETSLAATALLDRNAIASNPEAKARLDALLKPVIGKPAFIDLVQRLSLTGFEKELLDYILAHPSADESVTAAKLIAANRDGTADLLAKAELRQAKALATVLGRVSDRASVAVLNTAFWKVKDHGVRTAMIEALALSGEGGRAILKWHKENKLPEDLKAGAALALSRSTDAGLRDQASKELPVPAALGAEQFPSLPDLMKMTGDVAKGQMAFMTAGCVGCHQVKSQFINFGPDLSVIGNKLSKDGLFTAVLYPSAAIEHSYNGVTITTEAGAQMVGYIISDTNDELTLKIAGGAQQSVKKADITKREEMKSSLMPPGLAAGIGPQGLADLVAWMQTLK